MDKQLHNKGFTFLEVILVLSILATLTLLTLPKFSKFTAFNINFVINDIAFTQYQAIVDGEYKYYQENDTDIYFNRKGGINHADTYDVNGIDIIVTLGTGRIYIDDE